jgi:hypothetical protein
MDGIEVGALIAGLIVGVIFAAVRTGAGGMGK